MWRQDNRDVFAFSLSWFEHSRHNHFTLLRFCFQVFLQRHFNFGASDKDHLDFLFWFHHYAFNNLSDERIVIFHRVIVAYPQDPDALVRFIIWIIITTAGSGINWMAWYLPNTDLKPFLLLNIQFAQGFQKALSGFLVPLRFPWASKSTRSAAKTESLKPRSQFLIFYAQGSAVFGVRTPVSRYCSHKNHFPSLPRWRSFIGRGSSAPPHGIKSFIYPCSSAETWLLSTTIVYGSEGV